MILDSINDPSDLDALDQAQLDELCGEIRRFIVDAVARTGGHLGSNLGAVELTIALHRVFDSPHDIILWDTGHQAYVHKIITGRRDDFGTLRQAGGLSGYPSRAESPHDWVENSHASTIISYAHGLATAEEATGDNRKVVAVIGDGSMTGGMAYEALNNLGHSGRNAIIVLNDNGRSYAPTVSKLSESLIRIRMNPDYTRRSRRLEQLLDGIPWLGRRLAAGYDGAKAAARQMFEPPAFFETLGVRYLGPFDGHDIEAIEQALKNAAAHEGPVVVHVLTRKGLGYLPAEEDDVKHLHDTSMFDPATGPQKSPAQPTYTAAFTESLIKAGEHHPRLVSITAAMPGSTGLIPFEDRFPDRCFDVGIAEQHAVTAAAGMAMGGLRPVVAVYSTFLSRAFDQVNLDVGLHSQPVIFCIDRAGVTGDDGPSHHGVLDLALLTKVPGMVVLAPSSYQELQAMFEDALEMTDGPVAIRWPKGPAREIPANEVGSGLKARKIREGSDAVILAVGKMVESALDAAERLSSAGTSAAVWDVRCCAPLDPAMIADAAGYPVVVTVEDGIRDGGVGSAIRDQVGALGGSSSAVTVLGTPVEFIPHGKVAAIHASLGLDGAGVAATVAANLAVK